MLFDVFLLYGVQNQKIIDPSLKFYFLFIFNLLLHWIDNLGVETELVAEAVFITITDAFNKYRAKLESS